MRVFIKKSRLVHAVFRPRGLVCLSLLLLAVIGAELTPAVSQNRRLLATSAVW